MPRLPESLVVLRGRDFRLVFGAFAVSVLGDRMVTVALAFAVLELGGSASEVGLVLACRILPLVATLLIGGVIADRVSRRGVMVAADLARLATQGTLGLLLIVGEPPVWSLAALSGLTGMATGFFNPASTGLLPAVVAPEHLQQANGLRATAQSGGEIAGPAIAGVLVATAGPGWTLAIDGATFAISAAFLANLHPPRQLVRARASFMHDLRTGWNEFRSRSWVWSLVVAASLGNLLWAPSAFSARSWRSRTWAAPPSGAASWPRWAPAPWAGRSWRSACARAVRWSCPRSRSQRLPRRQRCSRPAYSRR
jgi:MFS family permease